MKSTAPFKQGIDRLKTAWKKSLVVCLMCSEGRPEDCHRTKLIGQVIESEGMRVQHVDAHGQIQSQQDILRVLSKGQASLFDETFVSRKKYRVDLP